MPLLLKNYSPLQKIAHGGMSELFRAIEVSTNRVVVIKKIVLPQEHRSLFLKRFESDIRNISSLSHSNIISIIDYGNDGDNFYLAMEHINGCNFDTLISDNTFDSTVGLMILLKVLQALHFSHTKGIVHCDIKPSNVLIDRTGRVVLSDFGISQAINHSNGYSDFSTPLFMPPEQACLVSAQVDLESDDWAETASVFYNDLTPEQIRAIVERGIQWDIWSVGVLLYRVCSGYYPFYENDFADLLKSIMHSEPQDILTIAPYIPNPIAAVIKQCLQKEPYLRPSSLDPLIDALQEFFISIGIFNVEETIATYMSKRNDPYLIPEKSFAASDPSTTQGESEWEFNDFFESLTTQEKSSVTHDNPTVIQNESEWEYSEYKTLQYVPPKKKSSQRSIKLLPKKISNWSSPYPKIQRSITNGVESLTSLFSTNRRRLTSVMIVLATLIALFTLGILATKLFTYKHDKIAKALSTNVKTTSAIPAEHKVLDSVPEKPVQNSVNTSTQSASTQPTAVTVLTDSNTQKDIPSAGTIYPKAVKTRKIVQPVAPVSVSKPNTANTANLPGILKITIDPPEGRVFIDGVLADQSEIANGKQIVPGGYIISAKAAGYETYYRTVVIESNKTLIFSINLKPDIKGNGQLHIYSYPWANLYIDGELVGTTPTPSPILLAEGDHNVVLKRDGFKQHSEVVTIKNSDIVRLKVQLEKAGE